MQLGVFDMRGDLRQRHCEACAAGSASFCKGSIPVLQQAIPLGAKWEIGAALDCCAQARIDAISAAGGEFAPFRQYELGLVESPQRVGDFGVERRIALLARHRNRRKKARADDEAQDDIGGIGAGGEIDGLAEMERLARQRPLQRIETGKPAGRSASSVVRRDLRLEGD